MLNSYKYYHTVSCPLGSHHACLLQTTPSGYDTSKCTSSWFQFTLGSKSQTNWFETSLAQCTLGESLGMDTIKLDSMHINVHSMVYQLTVDRLGPGGSSLGSEDSCWPASNGKTVTLYVERVSGRGE